MASHHAKKRFGQNFLTDSDYIQRMANSIRPQQSDHIVEIGPGQGALTCQLLPLCQQLDAIEIDWDLIPQLEQRCEPLGTLNLFQQDVLTFDFTALPKRAEQLRIVGNLPYNISTPLIFHLLEQLPLIKDMHFLLQKEVVDRLAGEVGTKAYGRLSVMVQYHCQVHPLFTVPNTAFTPPPKVQSTFVRLVPHDPRPYPDTDLQQLSLVVREAFNHRRKTLHNCLKHLITDQQLIDLGIDPKLRPEQVSVGDFVKIANCIDLRD